VLLKRQLVFHSLKAGAQASGGGWRCMRVATWITYLAGAALAACTQLPVDGPHHRDITHNATAALVTDRRAVAFEYALVDIDRNVLDGVVDVGPGSFFRTFGAGSGPPPAIRVGVGDVVQVSIFESAAGGLFIPAEAGVRPGNFVTLPPQHVEQSGAIAVPYAGTIGAAGRTINEIQREIERKLANRAIEPQAVITLVEQNATEVAVVGDVINGANKFRIRLGGERILDMISRAGGIRFPGHEAFVTLQRGKRRATVYFPALINNPAENIYVGPGDTIYVFREQQKFVALGALAANGQTSGLTAQFAFEQEKLSLNEAVARAGGLQDSRANPRQVFLYRMEYREVLRKIGIDLSKFPASDQFIPTVYRANFRDPSSFFSAQGFQMRHKDIIYVSNADSVEVIKFLDYVRAITSTVSGVATDTVVTQDALRGRHVLGQ
jgi:polysaccharide biosynthesis/export protein